MTETIQFESIKIEAYISASWVDITADVLQQPAPQWNMGIMGNSPIDRIGDPEIFTFALNNSETNSGAKLGYYTPGHENCRAGWGTGVPVRLVFTYETQDYYKYYGQIAPDGINTEPGIYGRRAVEVRCEGFMALADRHILELLELQIDLKIEEAVPYILANMPIQPLETEYGSGEYTFPTVFDTLSGNTSATSELQKLAMSEWGRIYTTGNITNGQTLVVEGKTARTNKTNTIIPIESADSGFLLKEDGDYLLQETGDKIILQIGETIDFDNAALDGVKTQYGANLSNWITGRSYPREVDAVATTVLFATQRRIYVESGETVENIRGRYRDPNGAATYINGRNMVTPVSGTDYDATANEDGTGADYTANISVTATYGTEQVDYSISNSGANGAWIYLQARGKGIYLYDPITKIFTDETSRNTYGKFPLNVDMPYQDDPLIVESICASLLNNEKDPYTTVDAYPLLANRDARNMFAFLILEPGTRARFAEYVTGVDANYFINGYTAKIINGRYVIWSPVLQVADDTIYWQLDVSELDTETILDT